MGTKYGNLKTDYKSLNTENNQLKLQHTELQDKLGNAREQYTQLDVENTMVTNKREVLHQLNLSVEEDRKSLVSQVSLLLPQYHDILTQTLDDGENYHEEEREHSDKVRNRRRQNEKLEEKNLALSCLEEKNLTRPCPALQGSHRKAHEEPVEKIREQCKRMRNSATPKKKGLGSTLERRMRKAGSTVFINWRPTWGRGQCRCRQQREEHDSSRTTPKVNDKSPSSTSTS